MHLSILITVVFDHSLAASFQAKTPRSTNPSHHRFFSTDSITVSQIYLVRPCFSCFSHQFSIFVFVIEESAAEATRVRPSVPPAVVVCPLTPKSRDVTSLQDSLKTFSRSEVKGQGHDQTEGGGMYIAEVASRLSCSCWANCCLSCKSVVIKLSLNSVGFCPLLTHVKSLHCLVFLTVSRVNPILQITGCGKARRMMTTASGNDVPSWQSTGTAAILLVTTYLTLIIAVIGV